MKSLLDIPTTLLQQCAQLTKQYSKEAKTQGSVTVMYSMVSDIKSNLAVVTFKTKALVLKVHKVSKNPELLQSLQKNTKWRQSIYPSKKEEEKEEAAPIDKKKQKKAYSGK